MKKKIVGVACAFALALSMGSVAFADTDYSDMETVTLTKNYENPNNGVSPAETFTFGELTCIDVEDAAVGITTDNAPLPEVEYVSFDEGDAGKVIISGSDIDYKCLKDVVIILPEYTGVGIYTYTFKEIAGDTAGVTYYGETITLVVTVIEQDGKVRVAAVHTESPVSPSYDEDSTKSDVITNIYNCGQLAVSKQVTGNMGDQSKDFNVTVTFTAPADKIVKSVISYTDDGETSIIAPGDNGWTGSKEVVIDLKHGETVNFTNIPAGVTYTVVEADYTDNAAVEANKLGYDEATYACSDTADVKSISGGDTDTVTITNTKSVGVDTALSLESMPFVVMLVAAGAGLAAFAVRRRQED